MEPPTVREVIRRLESEGFVQVGQKGDHRRYARGSQKVTVAGKPSEHLLRKTWKSIEQQAGW